jgi:hypothetical protein
MRLTFYYADGSVAVLPVPLWNHGGLWGWAGVIVAGPGRDCCAGVHTVDARGSHHEVVLEPGV